MIQTDTPSVAKFEVDMRMYYERTRLSQKESMASNVWAIAVGIVGMALALGYFV